jgi:hypothetical protein
MDIQTLFWNAPLEDMVRGYCYQAEAAHYLCLICGRHFENGEVFPVGDRFFSAERMCTKHIEEDHGSVFDYLITFNKGLTGLSDQQRDVLIQLHAKKTDQQIAQALKLTSTTIRHYRFKFREKERQAKVYLALMMSLKDAPEEVLGIVEPHRSATTIDERYHITDKERKTVLSNYFNEAGQLLQFPTKEKRKIIVLTELSKLFKADKIYTEKDIKTILSRVYEDHVTIRRYLIEYGFLDRNTDGSGYWVHGSTT